MLVFHCRCVCDQQRSFALGIQWIVVRTLGTVLYKEAKHSCVVCSLHKSRRQAQEPPSILLENILQVKTILSMLMPREV